MPRCGQRSSTTRTRPLVSRHTTSKRGLNHVAFTVRDIHEVFGGGMNFSRCGWETDLGPGRHPVSSAYFWYFRCPAGAMTEYYANEDQLTPAWKARDMEFKPENFAEWAIAGGLDGIYAPAENRTRHGSARDVRSGREAIAPRASALRQSPAQVFFTTGKSSKRVPRPRSSARS